MRTTTTAAMTAVNPVHSWVRAMTSSMASPSPGRRYLVVPGRPREAASNVGACCSSDVAPVDGSALPRGPVQDRARVCDDRAVRQLERRQLRVSGRRAQIVARALAEEPDRVAVAGDHLLVLDSGATKRLLHATTRMHPRASVIAVADEQRRSLGHPGPPWSWARPPSRSRPRQTGSPRR